MRVEWVHPSWRDLVIEYLAEDDTARMRFLSRCGIHGMALALSIAGGRDGRRQLPLMVDDADWDALTDRAYVLVPDLDTSELVALLGTIENAVRRTDRDRHSMELLALGHSVLERLVSIWDGAKAPVSVVALGGWFALAARLPPEPTPVAPPNLIRTWAELFPAGPPDLADRASMERFADWLALADLLRAYRPAELERLHFDTAYETIEDFLTDVERNHHTIHPAAQEHAVTALRRIGVLNPWLSSRATQAADGLEFIAREYAAAREYPEPAVGGERLGWRQFDVSRVLQDL